MGSHDCYLEEGSVLMVEASACTKLQRWFRLYWKYIVLILTPLLCCPVLILLHNAVC